VDQPQLEATTDRLDAAAGPRTLAVEDFGSVVTPHRARALPSGQTIPNLVIVPLGANGGVSLYALKSVHLLADVFGYFTDSSAPDSDQGLFVPLTPQLIPRHSSDATTGRSLHPGSCR
jgi:hypothetical protein